MKYGLRVLSAVLALFLVGPAVSASGSPLSSAGSSMPPVGGCAKVGYVGASLSDYGLGSAREIQNLLTIRGYRYVFNASSARSLRTAGVGSGAWAGNGIDVLRMFKGQGVDCFIVAVGTNDAAEVGGDYAAARARIEEATRVIGGSRVEWIAPVTLIADAGHRLSDRNMSVFRRALGDVATSRPGMRVHYWNRVAGGLPFLWDRDGVHLQLGKPVFAYYVVDALTNPA